MSRLHRFALLCVLTGCALEDEEAFVGDEVPADPILMDAQQLEQYAQLAPVAEPVALSEDDLGRVLELRRQYGLSADPDLVRAMHEHPEELAVVRSEKDLFGGLLLDESEVGHALERAEVEVRGPEADLWAQQELGDRYAGSLVEGTRLVLLCAGCDRHDVARTLAARRDLPEVLRGRVEVRAVEHSFAELQAMEERLAAYMRERGFDGNGTAVDIADNDIDVHAGPSTLALIESELRNFADAAGGPVELVASDIDPERHIYKHQALPYGLVTGGQYIDNGAGGACSSGFAVEGYYGPFMLTAGHCAGINQTWYQGGAPLGRVALIDNGPRMDVAAITTWGIRVNWGRVHRDYYDDRAAVIAVTDSNMIGQTVCNSGWASTGLSGLDGGASRCGLVIAHNYRPYPSKQAVWGLAGYRTRHGDSGAGIYMPTGYGMGAVGINSSIETLGSSISASVYTRMRVVLDTWGMRLSPF